MLDAGLICHLGLEVDGWPVVVPTSYGRQGDRLYLHGSAASRTLRAAKQQVPICVTVSLVDGLVLARSVFSHSVNYRSAMVFGYPEVCDGADKLEGLRVITEHMAPGQWQYVRRPTDKELAQTTVLRLGLEQASVKIRSGGPGDSGATDEDMGLWAGELPIRIGSLEPVADPNGPTGPLPEHLAVLGERLAKRLAPPG